MHTISRQSSHGSQLTVQPLNALIRTWACTALEVCWWLTTRTAGPASTFSGLFFNASGKLARSSVKPLSIILKHKVRFALRFTMSPWLMSSSETVSITAKTHNTSVINHLRLVVFLKKFCLRHHYSHYLYSHQDYIYIKVHIAFSLFFMFWPFRTLLKVKLPYGWPCLSARRLFVLLVFWSVDLSVIISLKAEKFHFHALIGARVYIALITFFPF